MKTRKMLKPIILTATTMLFSSVSYAQDHNAHDGHSHGAQPHGQTQDQNQAPQLPAPDFVFTEAPDDHVVGDEFAPITIITYASVTCSHCGNWFTNIWPEVQSQLVDTQKIRFVLREFPTAPSALSMTGFAMAQCAPEEDYMSVIEYQMENQEKIFEQARAGEGKAAYAKVAKIAGLKNDAEISACLSNPSATDHINLSLRRAEAAGVKGVPAFFINGEAYKGDQSAKALTKLVNTMLETGSSSLPKATPSKAHH